MDLSIILGIISISLALLSIFWVVIFEWLQPYLRKKRLFKELTGHVPINLEILYKKYYHMFTYKEKLYEFNSVQTLPNIFEYDFILYRLDYFIKNILSIILKQNLKLKTRNDINKILIYFDEINSYDRLHPPGRSLKLVSDSFEYLYIIFKDNKIINNIQYENINKFLSKRLSYIFWYNQFGELKYGSHSPIWLLIDIDFMDLILNNINSINEKRTFFPVNNLHIQVHKITDTLKNEYIFNNIIFLSNEGWNFLKTIKIDFNIDKELESYLKFFNLITMFNTLHFEKLYKNQLNNLLEIFKKIKEIKLNFDNNFLSLIENNSVLMKIYNYFCENLKLNEEILINKEKELN